MEETTEEEKILQRLKELNSEYSKKKRKLKKSQQAAKAKAHVRQRLEEQKNGDQQEKVDGGGDACALLDSVRPEEGLKNSDAQDNSEHGAAKMRNKGLVNSQDIFASPGVSHDAPHLEPSTTPVPVQYISTPECYGQSRESETVIESPTVVTSSLPEDSVSRNKQHISKRMSLSVSKYKNKNHVTRQKVQLESSDEVDITEQSSSKPDRMGGVTEQLTKHSSKPFRGFDGAQVIVFERQTAFSSQYFINKNTKDSFKTSANGNMVYDMESTISSKNSDPADKSSSADEATRNALTELQSDAGEKDSSINQNQNVSSAAVETILKNSCFKINHSDSSPSPVVASTNTVKLPKRRKRRSSSIRDTSIQRRSSRIAEQGSQDTWSPGPGIVSPDGQLSKQRSKSHLSGVVSARKSKQCILLTSVFQCLVDEGKRKKETEDFSLPDRFLDAFCGDSEHSLKSDFDKDIEKNIARSDIPTVASLPSFNPELESSSYLKGLEILDKHKGITGDSAQKSLSESKVDHCREIQMDTSTSEAQNHHSSVGLSDIVDTRPCDQCVSANSSKTEVVSPLLFESQSDQQPAFTFDNILHGDTSVEGVSCLHLIGKNEKDSHNSSSSVCVVDGNAKKDCCKGNFSKDPSGVGLLKENLRSRMEIGDSTYIKMPEKQNAVEVTEPDHSSTTRPECEYDSSDGPNTCTLRQTFTFQVPPGETILSLVCVEGFGQDTPYVACLTQKQLNIFTCQGSNWVAIATHQGKFNIRKKNRPMLYGLLDCDRLCLVLLENQSGSTAVVVYTLRGTSLHRETVDMVQDTSFQVCPLVGSAFVVSRFKSSETSLTKYTVTRAGFGWRQDVLDSVDGPVVGLCRVRDVPAALLGFTNFGTLYIWNHQCGILLSTVDISDVYPQHSVCPLAYSEQGFLVMPVVSRKKQQSKGCVLVVNPHLGTSETLLYLPSTLVVNGCSAVSVMSDLLLMKSNSGVVEIFNLYTGGYLATIDDAMVTCLSATNQHLALGHKDCFHIYRLIDF